MKERCENPAVRLIIFATIDCWLKIYGQDVIRALKEYLRERVAV